MPSESIEITSYTYYLFSSREDWRKAVAVCAGSGGQTVYLYFIGGSTPLEPAQKTGADYSLFFRHADMPLVIDMLRNEKPVFVHYIPDGTNNSRISTTSEPVGEGERH
jgi:hypothetical protein